MVLHRNVNIKFTENINILHSEAKNMYTVAPEDSRSQSLLPLHLITAGTQHIQETRIRPKGLSFHQILIVEEGEGILEWANHTRVLKAGNAIFIPKGFPCTYKRLGNAFITGWVAFDGPGSEKLLDYFHASPLLQTESAPIAPLIIESCRLIRRGESPEVLSALLYQLIISFFDAARKSSAVPALEKAKEYARKHLETDLSVSDLARAAGISPSLLHRLFQQEKTTPVSFLKRERIRKAKELLLQSPEQKIAEIAQACGFSDCAYFCKVFREETRESPLQYRKKYV